MARDGRKGRGRGQRKNHGTEKPMSDDFCGRREISGGVNKRRANVNTVMLPRLTT